MKTKDKMFYSLDSGNGLTVQKGNKTLKPKGEFSIERDSLFYKFDEPDAWKQTLNLPSKKEFIGNWRLNKNHDLEFALKEIDARPEKGVLRFKGEIIAVEEDRLIFLLTAKRTDDIYRTQLIKLSGKWHLDENNRIVFIVKKQTEEDILTFEAAWEINANQRILYRYEKTDLIRRTKIIKTLTFNGYWDITEKNRLRYTLGKTEGSVFDFRVHLESPVVIGKERSIKYRVGIGLSGRKFPFMKTVVIFGKWKLNEKSEIAFEIEYEKGIFSAIGFTGNFRISEKRDLAVELKNRLGKELDIKILFDRKFLKGERAVSLRFRKRDEEKLIETGVRFPW